MGLILQHPIREYPNGITNKLSIAQLGQDSLTGSLHQLVVLTLPSHCKLRKGFVPFKFTTV